MSITPISAGSTNLQKRCEIPSFCGDETKQPQKPQSDSADKFISKIENLSPAAVGLGSAVLWFGVGIGLDRLIGMAFKSMKSSMKTSLIVNGVFGAVMGVASYFKAKKEG